MKLYNVYTTLFDCGDVYDCNSRYFFSKGAATLEYMAQISRELNDRFDEDDDEPLIHLTVDNMEDYSEGDEYKVTLEEITTEDEP